MKIKQSNQTFAAIKKKRKMGTSGCGFCYLLHIVLNNLSDTDALKTELKGSWVLRVFQCTVRLQKKGISQKGLGFFFFLACLFTFSLMLFSVFVFKIQLMQCRGGGLKERCCSWGAIIQLMRLLPAPEQHPADLLSERFLWQGCCNAGCEEESFLRSGQNCRITGVQHPNRGHRIDSASHNRLRI